MEFEGLPATPTADELVDQAFSRAARAGGAKSGVDAQESMLQTASNVLHDNLENVVRQWPDLDDLDPFYRELADAVLRRTLESETEPRGIDALRTHLSELSWAATKSKELGREYMGHLGRDPETARKFREQGFARMASVLEEVEDDLAAVDDARNALRELPDIRTEEPTVVVAGYPNVGKSAFVNAVTNADNDVAEYPFTTKGVAVGHFERDRIRYQLVDTPGLLDRPATERNDIESQAVSAVAHLADCLLFFVDASGRCGYPLDRQLALGDELAGQFGERGVPFLTVCNKADHSTDVAADHYISVTEEEGLDAVLAAAVEAIDHEPGLPFETG